jgi:hypothetical protein
VTDLLPVEPDRLASEIDPVGYMTTVLNRAKGWLEEAQSIDEVRNAKAIAVGYEAVIREKELAFDAQLAATEIVRRCERRVVELVKAAQKAGEVRRRGQSHPGRDLDERPMTVGQFVNPGNPVRGERETWDLNPLAEVPMDQFEQALVDARQEGNLSRANVIRKATGEPKPANGRSEWHRKKRHLDSNHALRETAAALDAVVAGLSVIDVDQVDLTDSLPHLESIRSSITALNRFVRGFGNR